MSKYDFISRLSPLRTIPNFGICAKENKSATLIKGPRYLHQTVHEKGPFPYEMEHR